MGLLNMFKKVPRTHLGARHQLIYDLEGTYLQWMDFSGLGLNKDELEKLMHESDLFFDEGYIFGEEGNGYERMNLACPTKTVMQALERLKKITDKLLFSQPVYL